MKLNKRLLQLCIEEKYNRKAIRKRVMEDLLATEDPTLKLKFCDAIARVGKYLTMNHNYDSKNHRISLLRSTDLTEEDIVYETVAAVATSLEPQPIQAVAARLANQFEYGNPVDAAKTASEIIAVVCYSDLYDIIPAAQSTTGTLMVKARFCLEEKTLRAISIAKYLPPMVCPPKKVKCDGTNMDTSHMTFKDSLLLGTRNHHGEFLCTDVINIANRVKLSLDEDILMYQEESNKPLDTPEKIQQFNKMATDSVVVYEEILEADNEFYFTWKYDFRGRMYSQGYHINIQSTDYKKALINFARKEVITV